MVFNRGNIYIFHDAVYLFVYLFLFQNLKKTILKIRLTYNLVTEKEDRYHHHPQHPVVGRPKNSRL